MKDKECKECNNVYQSMSNNSKFCSFDCRDLFKFKVEQIAMFNGNEGYDYVVDQWNGYATTRIYGHWFTQHHPNRTTEEYRIEFPNAKLQCDKISAKNGQFMKEEKHREAQRQRMIGSNNPNHTSKTTVEQRKSKSPFSKDFVNYKSEEDRKKFIDSIDYGSIKKSSDIEWWLKKCNGNIEEAERLYTERQTTFTLDKCILKHGKSKGTTVYNDRQEKWLKSFPRTNYSKISQDLFVKIYEHIKHDFKEIYFATLNNKEILEFNNGRNYEYTLRLNNSSIKPDFFIKETGKIIEFDGVYWHRRNPENKKREESRNNQINKAGYSVYHVNESDYNKDPNGTIQLCLEFLR
jgi:G:T-mismatch repair DNA endonuclease (very short patch repair protein)